MGNVKGLSANTPGSAMLLLKLVSVADDEPAQARALQVFVRGRAVMAAPRRSDTASVATISPGAMRRVRAMA